MTIPSTWTLKLLPLLPQHKAHQMGLSPSGLFADVSALHEWFAAFDKRPDYILPSPGEAVWLPDTVCSKWNWSLQK